MSKKNKKIPFFPYYVKCGSVAESKGGADLRDVFAMSALAGMLANTVIAKSIIANKNDPKDNHQWHTDAAYQFADAMLESRTKTEF